MFTDGDLDLIRETVERFSSLSRTELALTLCENLPWQAPNGQARLHSCLSLLEEMDADGIVKIPAKRVLAPYRPARMHTQPLPLQEIVANLRELQPVMVEAVAPEEQALWDATVDRYHALGFRRAFGAHQRYWIRGELGGCRVTLGALLFAAAARNVAVRDAWLGWTSLQQQRYRHLIVANSRFLILPGVRVPHLASHALSLALRGLRSDWKRRFGYAPVVVETFVEPPWRGTCYRAANWLHLGQTTGQGRQDRQYSQGGAVREVFAYPLVRNWRTALLTGDSALPAEGALAVPAQRPQTTIDSRRGR